MSGYDLKQDSEAIHKAVHGIGTDEDAVINIIARRPNWYIQKLREQYEKMYEVDLLKRVEEEVSCNFKKLLVGLIKSRSEYRGECVYKAIKGMGTDEHTLIDFVIAIDDHSLEDFKQFFRQKYECSLVDWVKGDTTGDFEKILVKCLQATRSEKVENDKIDSDVEKLYKAGEGKWGTDEDTFVEILSHRSFEHLQKVAEEYKKKHKNTLEHAIKSEISGWFETALLACLQPPTVYWADRKSVV